MREERKMRIEDERIKRFKKYVKVYIEIIIDKRNENLQKSDTVEKDFSTKKSNKIQ